MMNTNKKTIIFDMDGTILDSEKAICESINYMRKKLGLSELSYKFIIEVINDMNKNSIVEFYGSTIVSNELKTEFEKIYSQNYKKFATLYDGIINLLENCKKNGYFIALASNGPTQTLEGILSMVGIRKYFDFVIGADKQTPQKPDPTMLFKVLEKSNFKKAIFLGDSKKDEIAAKNAKIEYLQVTWGMGKNSDNVKNAKTTQLAWQIIKNF